MLDRARPFSAETWVSTWIRTAAAGLVILLVVFLGYEVVERVWLLGKVPTETLFRLHITRGVGASLFLATWSFINVWRIRRRYDAEFAQAYEQLEADHRSRTEALRRSQEFTERLFDALRDRVVVIDRRGRVVKANRVALQSMGPGAVGRPCTALVPCPSGGHGCIATQALREGRPILGTVRADPKTGRVYLVEAYPVPDPESGQEVVLETARDITEAQQYQARLREQEKLAALGVLAAGIAHDIGNPLASICSELELLDGETEIQRVRGSLAVVRRHLDRIGRTIREMTDFARRRGEDRAHFSLHIAVEDALRMVRHDPRARGLRLSVEVSPSLPQVFASEDQVVMVLVNLLINAFDATPAGGEIRLSASREAPGIRLQVRDTGSGMSEEVLRRAMDPLFTTKAGRGTGLGLTVSEEVMRALGGSLSLESAEGAGTTVTLHFPLAATEEVAVG